MQMLASGNELTANGNRESTRMKTANGREMIRKRTKFEPQMDADIGFGLGSFKRYWSQILDGDRLLYY
jgi:hypothetical protein